MDFGFISSPLMSPTHSTYTSGQYFDSTDDSSNPSSPYGSQVVFNANPLQFEMYSNTGQIPQFYVQQPPRIPIEFTGSTTLDQHDRRRRRSSSSTSPPKDTKEVIPNMHLRRRAQNRASQRAFRQRKEQHVKSLEHQLEDLHEKHQDLLHSYTCQADEVSKLNSRIRELTAEVQALRSTSSSQAQPFSDLLPPDKFDKFDAFSCPGDMLYDGPAADASYLDGSGGGMDSQQFDLHEFEESL